MSQCCSNLTQSSRIKKREPKRQKPRSSYNNRRVPGSSLPIDEHVYCFIKASLSLQNSKNSFTTVSYSTKTRFSQCYSVTPWIPPYTRSLHIHCVLYYLCYKQLYSVSVSTTQKLRLCSSFHTSPSLYLARYTAPKMTKKFNKHGSALSHKKTQDDTKYCYKLFQDWSMTRHEIPVIGIKTKLKIVEHHCYLDNPEKRFVSLFQKYRRLCPGNPLSNVFFTCSLRVAQPTPAGIHGSQLVTPHSVVQFQDYANRQVSKVIKLTTVWSHHTQ